MAATEEDNYVLNSSVTRMANFHVISQPRRTRISRGEIRDIYNVLYSPSVKVSILFDKIQLALCSALHPAFFGVAIDPDDYL